MTNFVKTMRDWQRMCKYYDDHYTEDSCNKCPLKDVDCGAIWEMDKVNNWEDYENIIQAWAAEHPEPKYPTWREYLKSIGLIIERDCQYRECLPDGIIYHTEKNAAILNDKADYPIPAEIATQLELEPKV